MIPGLIDGIDVRWAIFLSSVDNAIKDCSGVGTFHVSYVDQNIRMIFLLLFSCVLVEGFGMRHALIVFNLVLR